MNPLKLLPVAALVVYATYAFAQAPLIATTADGRRVVLAQDGTWKFVPAETGESKGPTAVFKKSIAATETVTINKGAASFSYDPGAWKISKQDDPNKLTFEHKSGDIYGMIIAERLEMSPDALIDLALSNAKNAATSVTVIQREKAVVNGVEVTHLLFEPTIKGVVFSFDGYYYAGPAGTIQLLSYTGKNLYPQYKEEMQAFLNGLELVSPK